ncbi:MAG: hypothetical protein H3Z52_08155 [archaeon]|nr:hypothetical protein [archaeon]MCP8320896.1 hypothetical protein [archaeon]
MDIPWIDQSTVKGKQITALLERVMVWRRACGLSGSSKEYDFFLGCYGNPNSSIMFLAEVPSLKGLQKAIRNFRNEPLWQSAWNVSYGNKVFRETLFKNGFITNQNEPWKWKCWITDLVKCGEKDKDWKSIKKNNPEMKSKILQKSAEFLEEEIGIIKPKMIVVMRNQTADLYDEYIKSDVLDVRAPHYARMASNRIPIYKSRFKKIKKWFNQLK